MLTRRAKAYSSSGSVV